MQVFFYEFCKILRTLILQNISELLLLKRYMITWFKKLQGMRQIVHLKQTCFLSFTFYKTQRSYKKIMYVYFLFYWFNGENCMFLFSSHKGQQTSKELKRKMNDGTIVFLASLLIVLTWKFVLFFLIQDNFMF